MDNKLNFNALLKGVLVFTFVAFCLLAILAGVTLPFVSKLNTVDNVAFCSESDVSNLAVASADSDSFNPLDFCTPLSACNSTTTYYGFYISQDLFDYITNYDFSSTSGLLVLSQLTFTGSTSSFYLLAGRNSDNTSYFGLTDMANFINFVQGYFNYSYYSPYVIYPQGFNLTSILQDVPSDSLWSTSVYVFTSVPFGGSSAPVVINGFESRFGNFDNLASNNIYVNLSTDIILPDIFYAFRKNYSTAINGWYFIGEVGGTSIYGLSLFDRFYYNGTEDGGYLNCGFRVTRKVISSGMPPTNTLVGTLDFLVSDVVVWSADCDFVYDSNTDIESITNIRNGSFKVSPNYEKDTFVFYFPFPDSRLFLINNNYNKSYDVFRSFVVQQDYRKVKIPPDNALYLNGYQVASKEYYQSGYDKGFTVGKNVGYDSGFSAGDSNGYQRGVSDGSNYSFLSLFGAVFDAPIQALFGGTQRLPAGTKITDSSGNTITLQTATTVNRGGLLNFELMGVNLSGFVLALFSLSILIIVIKFALGKGR